jgi:membrane associated rhomboid family serine protease
MTDPSLSLVIVAIIIGSLIYAYLRKSSIALTIVITNFIIFLIMLSVNFLGYRELLSSLILNLGCKPSYILSAKFYTVFTHLYIHGSIIHILMNMLFLVFIGLAFEERVGRLRFALAYFTAGILGVLFNTMIFYLSPTTAPDLIGIGASGAIFGIMCSYAFLYPKDEVTAPLGFIWLPRVPVLFVAVLYFGIETFLTFMRVSDSVGHIVHVGGAAGGIVLAVLLKKMPVKVKHRTLNFELLDKLATNAQQQELLERIKQEEVKDIKVAWLEEFLKTAKCPNCDESLIIKTKKRYAKCESCEFKVKF